MLHALFVICFASVRTYLHVYIHTSLSVRPRPFVFTRPLPLVDPPPPLQQRSLATPPPPLQQRSFLHAENDATARRRFKPQTKKHLTAKPPTC